MEKQINSVGVDIIEISRIEAAIDRWGERFFNRVYTEHELKLCKQKPGRLACRFAGKEAVMKALGTGTKGVGWKEIEISSERSGKPLVQLNGKAKAKAASLGLGTLQISLSDSKEYAVAVVVSETE